MLIAPKVISLPLINGKRQEEAFAFPVDVGNRGNNPHIRVTVLDVIAAQKLAIQVEAVGIVDGGRLQKVEEAQFGGGDDAAKLGVGEGLIADEIDTGHLGLRPLADFEHKVDPVMVELDNLGVDLGRVIALPPVDVENALNVGLDAGASSKARAASAAPLELSVSVLTSVFPSKATRLMIGFSATVTTTTLPCRLICTSWKRPVPNKARRLSSAL